MAALTPAPQEQQLEDPGHAVNADQMLWRFQQIMAAHEPDPGQADDEHRYRNLAARLLQERRDLAEELSEEGLREEDVQREFERRNAALERFATVWIADDPVTARLNREQPATEPNETTSPHQAVMNTLPWRPMLALPGYDGEGALNSAIRTLGRRIFTTFPCFQKMAATAQDAEADPLGQIMTLSTLVDDQRDLVKARIETLKGSCLPVMRQRLPGLNAMPGYHPDIALALSEHTSFLLVRERQTKGAPINADTIYAWDGGLTFYRNNPDRIAELRALLNISGRGLAALPDVAATPKLR